MIILKRRGKKGKQGDLFIRKSKQSQILSLQKLVTFFNFCEVCITHNAKLQRSKPIFFFVISLHYTQRSILRVNFVLSAIQLCCELNLKIPFFLLRRLLCVSLLFCVSQFIFSSRQFFICCLIKQLLFFLPQFSCPYQRLSHKKPRKQTFLCFVLVWLPPLCILPLSLSLIES